MKISRRSKTNGVQSVGPTPKGTPRVDRPDAAPAAGPGPSGLEVSISPKATEVKQAQVAVKGIPDVREGLVETIQGEVDAGTYKRDSGVIAKRMVHEALRESIEHKPRR